MKTIFISSFHVLISRNILSSPLLDLLLVSGDTRVVILCPQEKQVFFTAEFSRPGVIIQWVNVKPRRAENLLRYLCLAATDTRTLAIKRLTELSGRGQWPVRLVGNRSWGRFFLRILDFWLTPSEPFDSLIADYRPDVIFATDVQHEADIRLIRAAKHSKIPCLAMVRSWDNLTAKGLIRAVPDILIVNNDIIKTEAAALHGIPESRIRVVGIPHYDRYLDGAVHSREEFCRRLGLNPKKRFLVYTPTGDRYLKENNVDADIIAILASALPPTHQLLVRLPPSDSSAINESSLPPEVIIHRPGRQLGSSDKIFKQNELSAEDDGLLRDTLFYGDLVVAGPSTIIIDAAVFDKPVILVGFDGYSSPPYYESIRRYWDYNHIQPVIRSGGARLVRNAEELTERLGKYLIDPALDRSGRERIIQEQCWKLDGRSSSRLTAALGEKMKN